MRLVRFGPTQHERWGALDDENIVRDLSGSLHLDRRDALTIDEVKSFQACDLRALPKVTTDARLGPPVASCGKIVCIGLNYRSHASESSMEVPKEPVIFMKATSAISGPYDDIVMPVGCTKLDWEVELGVVIGRTGSCIPVSEAGEYVLGYCIVNDVSERAFQLEGTGQWVKGKSADTFAPMGPWLVTKDEIADPQSLDLWLTVNGQARQNSSTQYMIFGINELISYVSRFMSLHPGDVIATGTPAGVGLGMSPPTYLNAGDVVRLGVTKLGEQCQTVVDSLSPSQGGLQNS
jgi:2-keto-4-pentenoate hydratase/2-oxohepta-3-ene-1,7-dioic acid hydratase in catechol pathway